MRIRQHQADDTMQSMMYSNAIINGGCLIAQKTAAAPSLSTTSQYGKVDRFRVHATGTAVSAGTIAQITSSTAGTTGYALHVSGATITGTGIVLVKHRIEAKNALAFKNLIASFACKVYHDVGSTMTYTITIRKATVADNFTAVTDISSTTKTAANTTATTIALEGVSMGDCSNGIEIEISVACGAITTKNFHYTEFQFNRGYKALAFIPKSYNTELVECRRYFQVWVTPHVMGDTTGATTVVNRLGMPIPEMRVAPTVTWGAINLYDGGVATTLSTVSTSYHTTTTIEIDGTSAAAFTAGGRPIVGYSGASSATVICDAEL